MDTAEDRAQPMPPWVYASRMQETPIPTAPSALPRPLTPRVQLPNSQFSGSHLSQLSGPLFTEDRYSTSSGGDQESCDAEVDHITHHKTPSKANTVPILPGRPTSTPDTVAYSTQGDPDQCKVLLPVSFLVVHKIYCTTLGNIARVYPWIIQGLTFLSA